ncbi:GrpE, mitochondrial [Xanthoria parietina]
MIQRSLLRPVQAIRHLPRPYASRATPIARGATQRLPAISSHHGLSSQRYYSAAAEPATNPSSEPPNTSSASSEAQEQQDPAKKELDSKNREIIDLKDRYLRSVADFRNLQDRTKRDIQSARDFAIQKFAADLIESVDNLDRALGTVPTSKLAPQNSDPDIPPGDREYNKDLANLYDGLKMTETILMGTLKKHGMERFDPSEGEGEMFNPNLHEATFQTKVDGKEDGKVFMTQQKGFLLKGRVLRAAKVGVVKNS